MLAAHFITPASVRILAIGSCPLASSPRLPMPEARSRSRAACSKWAEALRVMPPVGLDVQNVFEDGWHWPAGRSPPAYLCAAWPFWAHALRRPWRTATVLKPIAILEVTVLAGPYTVRVLAGGAALGTLLSPRLLTFTGFFFPLSRPGAAHGELGFHSENHLGNPSGRGYQTGDLFLLQIFLRGGRLQRRPGLRTLHYESGCNCPLRPPETRSGSCEPDPWINRIIVIWVALLARVWGILA